MNLVLLTLVSIAGPVSPMTAAADQPVRAECPVAKAEAKPSAKTDKTSPKETRSSSRAIAEGATKPSSPAPVARKPGHPAYLFM